MSSFLWQRGYKLTFTVQFGRKLTFSNLNEIIQNDPVWVCHDCILIPPPYVWQWNVCHTCHVWGLLNLSDQIAPRRCCSDLPVYSAPMHCNGSSWKLQTHLGLEIVETKPSSNQRAIRIESEPTKSTYFATFSPKYLSNNTIQTSAMTCKNHGHGLSILTWFESDVCHLMTKMQISEWGCKCATLGA